jgi:hypothetical protein
MAKGTKEKQQATQEDIIKKFSEAPISLPTEEPKEEMTDTIVISNKRKLKLAPTKLRYFKTGDYGMYKLIEQIGVADILGYSDGFDIICKFLSAVFDKPYKIEDVKDENGEYTQVNKYDEYIVTLVDEELNIKDLESVVKCSLFVNGIKSENF